MAKRALKKSGVMNEGQLWQALELRYPKREYALLTEVRNGTGFARRPRTADAIALSLWPSRGLELHGFEVKSYRGDWRREKEAPEKADEIARFCDFWWLVVTSASIAPLDEVPMAWGVLAPNADATRLVVLRQPQRLEAQPMTRGFIASVLRNASDGMVAAKSVNAKLEDARAAGIKEGERRSSDVRELERLRKIEADVRAFEEASGVDITCFFAWKGETPKKLGKAMKTIVSNGQQLQLALTGLDRLADQAERIGELVRERRQLLADAAKLAFPQEESLEEATS